MHNARHVNRRGERAVRQAQNARQSWGYRRASQRSVMASRIFALGIRRTANAIQLESASERLADCTVDPFSFFLRGAIPPSRPPLLRMRPQPYAGGGRRRFSAFSVSRTTILRSGCVRARFVALVALRDGRSETVWLSNARSGPSKYGVNFSWRSAWSISAAYSKRCVEIKIPLHLEFEPSGTAASPSRRLLERDSPERL